jgi:hypothetical protein
MRVDRISLAILGADLAGHGLAYNPGRTLLCREVPCSPADPIWRASDHALAIAYALDQHLQDDRDRGPWEKCRRTFRAHALEDR